MRRGDCETAAMRSRWTLGPVGSARIGGGSRPLPNGFAIANCLERSFQPKERNSGSSLPVVLPAECKQVLTKKLTSLV